MEREKIDEMCLPPDKILGYIPRVNLSVNPKVILRVNPTFISRVNLVVHLECGIAQSSLFSLFISRIPCYVI